MANKSAPIRSCFSDGEAGYTHRGAFRGVPRHYIRCLKDRAAPLLGQDFMIAAIDDVLRSRIVTQNLVSSHAPFYSQALAHLLPGIALSLWLTFIV